MSKPRIPRPVAFKLTFHAGGIHAEPCRYDDTPGYDVSGVSIQEGSDRRAIASWLLTLRVTPDPVPVDAYEFYRRVLAKCRGTR